MSNNEKNIALLRRLKVHLENYTCYIGTLQTQLTTLQNQLNKEAGLLSSIITDYEKSAKLTENETLSTSAMGRKINALEDLLMQHGILINQELNPNSETPPAIPDSLTYWREMRKEES